MLKPVRGGVTYVTPPTTFCGRSFIYYTPYYYTCIRFGKHYELPLLVQSVIMIGTMMAMMHICVEVNADKGTVVRQLTGNIYSVKF